MIRASACSCGGQLHRASLDRIDLKPLFGIRGLLKGPIMGLRCDACHLETFEGTTFEQLRVTLAFVILPQTRLLASEEARFLRESILGLTQERLATRMAINKTTIADWERGERSISKEHDYELRGIAMSSLMDRPLKRSVVQVVRDLLNAPRTLAPPKRPRRYVIPAASLVAAIA